jgi:hypothetical protein
MYGEELEDEEEDLWYSLEQMPTPPHLIQSILVKSLFFTLFRRVKSCDAKPCVREFYYPWLTSCLE